MKVLKALFWIAAGLLAAYIGYLLAVLIFFGYIG